MLLWLATKILTQAGTVFLRTSRIGKSDRIVLNRLQH